MSSVEEGVAAVGVALDALLPRLRVFVLDGEGVASEAAKRPLVAGGGVTDAVEDEPRPRFRRPASPGEEYVFPIGLDCVSSGDEGPEISTQNIEELVTEIPNTRMIATRLKLKQDEQNLPPRMLTGDESEAMV